MAIYEMHLGSWMRCPRPRRPLLLLSAIAPKLAEYVIDRGFTHVEFLPLMEHPFYGSWGYQTTGYFAPTSRYGTPQDLMFLIDYLHQHGIGVILDWVPSHFTTDEHGLGYFDGTHLYEHADPRRGVHPDWHSYLFNYGRNEVRAFLLSCAMFWLDKYHVDGLRTDAVASMLYLDYSRPEGQWLPNRCGGRENLEAIQFLRNSERAGLRELSRRDHDCRRVDRLAHGLAAGLRRRAGLRLQVGHGLDARHAGIHAAGPDLSKIPPRQGDLPHGVCLLGELRPAASHDEVVYGKGSLLAKMPGDAWQKFANLRLLFGYMYAQPGKKLLFMGGEFGQWNEWNHDGELDWELLESEPHRGLRQWVDDLNRLYRARAGTPQVRLRPAGLPMDRLPRQRSERADVPAEGRAADADDPRGLQFYARAAGELPRRRHRRRISGTRSSIATRRITAAAAGAIWGSVESSPVPSHGFPASVVLTLPPLAIVFFKARPRSQT